MLTDTVDDSPTARPLEPESIAFAIASAIAAERGIDALDVPPLNDYVDVDALVALFRSADRRGAEAIDVSFRYDDLRVDVWRDGSVDVTPAPVLDDRPADDEA